MSSGSQRWVVFGGLAFLAAVAAIALVLSRGSSPVPREATDEAAAPAETGPAPIATGGANAPPEASPARTEAKGAPAPAAEVFPPAYEKALAGIVGRVVEQDGSPVKGAKVELLGGLLDLLTADYETLLFRPEEFAPRIEQQKVVTGEDGRFHFKRVDPRQFYLVGVNLGGGPRPQLRFVDRTPNPGEPAADLGDVPLDPPLALRGKLVDERGKPIAGARLRASTLPAVVYQAGVGNLAPDTGLLVREERFGSFHWQMPKWAGVLFEKLPLPAARSGPDGAFELQGAPAGSVTLLVDGADLPVGIHGPIPPAKAKEKDLGEVVVSRGEELEGVVVDENGAPVAGAEIVVGIPSPLAEMVAFLRKPITAGPDGRFVAKGIASKRVAILARAPEGADWRICGDFEMAGDEVTVRVPAPRSILVKIADEAGQPVAARLAIARDFASPGGADGFSPAFLPQLSSPIRARVEEVAKGSYRLRGFGAGSYSIFVDAPGFALARKPAKVEPAGDEPVVELRLERAGSIRVTVLERTAGREAPVEGAQVFAAHEGSVESVGFAGLGSSRTGADGIAHVRASGQGEVVVVASHPGFCNGGSKVTIPETKEITIVLITGGTIEGTLVKGTEPALPPRMLVVNRRFGGEGTTGFQVPRLTLSGLDGSFKVSHLEPGNYEVTALDRFANANIGALTQDYFELLNFMEEPPSERTEVLDGQVSRLVLDVAKAGREASADDGRVTGVVLRNGEPMPKAGVMLMGPEFKRVRTNEQGRFDSGPVRAGRYGVQVQLATKRAGYHNYAGDPVDLKAGETRNVEIPIVTAGPVRGFVGSPTAEPVPGAYVRAHRVRDRKPNEGNEMEAEFWGSDTSVMVPADVKGNFEIEEIGEGTYEFEANHPGYAAGHAGPVKVLRGSTPAPIEIRLKKAVVVEGRVDAALTQNTTWRGLSFQGTAGTQGSEWAEVRDDGSFRAESLAPGKYRVFYNAWSAQEAAGEGNSAAVPMSFAPIDLDVPADGLHGTVLRFEPVKPPPPGGPSPVPADEAKDKDKD